MGLQVGCVLEAVRGQDPLVLHLELVGDHVVPLRYGRDDSDAHDLSRHHPVQRVGDRRRGGRGDRLEARARRRLSEASLLEVVGRVGRFRDADPRDVRGDIAVCVAGLLVAGPSRGSLAVHDAALHLHGLLRRLRLREVLPDLRRRGLEDSNTDGGVLVSRLDVRHLLHAEPPHLGCEVLGRRSIHDDVRAPLAVVRNFGAVGIPRVLLWHP
mmetsp:Transcript_97665/g.273287  ORF Transcript_97665/g.273287 Transcript_97665/m.273287 type:complete len:212 (+) Transcript_97665:830-1465(+)